MASQLGKLLESNTIQPHNYGSGRVKKGQTLRIIDVEGKQAVDFVSFKADDPSEYCDMTYSCWHEETFRLTEGHRLITNHYKDIWTITEDDTRIHYCGGNFCSRDARIVAGIDDANGCRDTLEDGLEAMGYSKSVLHATSCFNIFMNVEFKEKGATWKIAESFSKPGDHIDLRAEMDLEWVVSVCAWPEGPCNGENPSPATFELYDAL